jgi:hypothetical protein
MAADRHVYGEINNRTGLKKVFLAIRSDGKQARSCPAFGIPYGKK